MHTLTIPTAPSADGARVDFLSTRRWIAGLSAVGAANMAIGSLRQLGIIHHLPDPPIRGFDSDAVITSPQAFALGVPDAPVAMAGLIADFALSRIGRRGRSATMPWLPVAIAAKAVVEVAVAGWYLVQMRTRLRVWCAYCLVGASINASIAALTLREASAALRTRRARLLGATAALVLAAAAFGAMHALDRRRSA